MVLSDDHSNTHDFKISSVGESTSHTSSTAVHSRASEMSVRMSRVMISPCIASRYKVKRRKAQQRPRQEPRRTSETAEHTPGLHVHSVRQRMFQVVRLPSIAEQLCVLGFQSEHIRDIARRVRERVGECADISLEEACGPTAGGAGPRSRVEGLRPVKLDIRQLVLGRADSRVIT